MIEFLVLILLLIAVALIFRVDFIVYVAYVLIAIFALSRWIVHRSLTGLEAGRKFNSRAFLAEAVEIEVHLKNRSRLPILWLQLIESVPPELRYGPAVNHVVYLGPGRERRLRYQVKAMKRGYYRLGPLQITSGDLFGFQEIQSTMKPDFLTVYPRIIPLQRLMLPSRLPFGTLAAKQKLFEDPARPHGFRDYRLGDSVRLINWKVSAHSDTLLVRTHQPAISLETTILLNLNTNDYSPRHRADAPEWAIVLAASLAAQLVSQRQAVGLVSNGLDPLLQFKSARNGEPIYDETSGRLTLAGATGEPATPSGHENVDFNAIASPIPPKPGREHLMQVLERLARIEAAPTVDFVPFALTTTKKLSWGVTLMVIVPSADESDCNAFHHLVRSGFNVVVFVIEQFTDFPSVQRRARLLGFQAYHLVDSQALRRWRQEAVGVSQ